jgi:hypothetical protein
MVAHLFGAPRTALFRFIGGMIAVFPLDFAAKSSYDVAHAAD